MPKIKLDNLVHQEKEDIPIFVTLLGILTFINPLHSLNLPILISHEMIKLSISTPNFSA